MPVPRRLGWVLALALAVGVFLGLGIFLGMDQERATRVYNTYGNMASFWGLVVAVVGFGLTIWTVLQTEKVSAEATARVETAVRGASEAIDRSRRESREAVEKIGKHLLASEAETFARLVLAAMQAADMQQWQGAVALCQEASHAGVLLAANPHLADDEQRFLRTAADELQLILKFIRKNRIGKATSAPLPLNEAQQGQLMQMRRLVSAIQGRLRGEVLEVPHAN